MQIDPKIQFPNDAQPDAVASPRSPGAAAAGATKPVGVSPSAGEDTVSLSSAHGEVQTLAASLGSVPEVRSDRVTALSNQVRQGQYAPPSQQVADAIIKEHGKLNVRA